jgi:hypothetical protein
MGEMRNQYRILDETLKGTEQLGDRRGREDNINMDKKRGCEGVDRIHLAM